MSFEINYTLEGLPLFFVELWMKEGGVILTQKDSQKVFPSNNDYELNRYKTK